MTDQTDREAVQYWYDAATERREERDHLRAVVARIRQMTDYWEQQLPEVIRTPAVVSAIRAALEPAAVLPAPTDQTAVLRDAADRIDATRAPFPIAVQNGITWATAELRRMAGEAQQAPTDEEVVEAHRLALSWAIGQPASEAQQDPTQDGPPCIPDHSLPVHCPGCAADEAPASVSRPGQPETDTETQQSEPKPDTPRCAHCTHPKSDHDGRADHREKYSPLVAGEPWCHACNAECNYDDQPADTAQQPKEA